MGLLPLLEIGNDSDTARVSQGLVVGAGAQGRLEVDEKERGQLAKRGVGQVGR